MTTLEPGTGPVIGDPRIVGIPSSGSDEPLVDAAGHLLVLPSVGQRLDLGPASTLVRRGVLERLLRADEALRRGRLALVEGHRSLERQRAEFDLEHARLAARHPDWNADRLWTETSRFVAQADLRSPHSSGGAVDITLVDERGEQLDVGCPVNGFETPQACPTDCPGLTATQRRRREDLVAAMTSAGFVNYPHEWWHWSFGDRYWAWRRGAAQAAYDGVVVQPSISETVPTGTAGHIRPRGLGGTDEQHD